MRVWLVVLLCTAVAYADPPTPAAKSAAAGHHRRARAFAAKHQLDDAIREDELSIEQVADPDVLFELAQLYDQKPDEDKAFATYQRITEGKHLQDAQTRLAAITAARAQREAETKARADADAKAKADEEARRAAEAAAAAARKADEDRRRSEQADREQRGKELDAAEAATRKQAEERQSEAASGAARADWELAHARHLQRRALGMRYLKLGLGCGAVAGIAAGIAALEYHRVDAGGFSTASDISRAITIGQVGVYGAWAFGVPAAIGIGLSLPLLVMSIDRGEYKVSAVASHGMNGFALSGPLP